VLDPRGESGAVRSRLTRMDGCHRTDCPISDADDLPFWRPMLTAPTSFERSRSPFLTM
jgi:hypothetical protein